jgi:hypothetical protein
MGDFWDQLWFNVQVAWNSVNFESPRQVLVVVGIAAGLFVIWRLLSSPSRR